MHPDQYIAIRAYLDRYHNDYLPFLRSTYPSSSSSSSSVVVETKDTAREEDKKDNDGHREHTYRIQARALLKSILPANQHRIVVPSSSTDTKGVEPITTSTCSTSSSDKRNDFSIPHTHKNRRKVRLEQLTLDELVTILTLEIDKSTTTTTPPYTTSSISLPTSNGTTTLETIGPGPKFLPDTSIRTESLNYYNQQEQIFTGNLHQGHRLPITTVPEAIDYGKAIDFSNRTLLSSSSDFTVTYGIRCITPDNAGTSFATDQTIYTLEKFPGCYIIPQALSLKEQEYWFEKICTSYVEPPNWRNFDGTQDTKHTHTSARSQHLYQEYTEWFDTYNRLRTISTDQSSSSSSLSSSTANNVSKKLKSSSSNVSSSPLPLLLRMNWVTLGYQYDWTERKYHLEDTRTSSLPPSKNASLSSSQRVWSTPFPTELRSYTSALLDQINTSIYASSWYKDIQNSSTIIPPSPSPSDISISPLLSTYGLPLSLQGDAGIVNFYHSQYTPSAYPNTTGNTSSSVPYDSLFCTTTTKAPMGGHQDNLEYNFTYPVVSISLGCPGIFLLGHSENKCTGPVVPILLRSGDIVILSGKCRLSYHGVARVFPCYCSRIDNTSCTCSSSCPSLFIDRKDTDERIESDARIPSRGSRSRDEKDSEKEKNNVPFQRFLRTRRININVRQLQ